ncbi:MAG: class I SAM-dependent methyltransferase [Sulfobacillus sp.]
MNSIYQMKAGNSPFEGDPRGGNTNHITGLKLLFGKHYEDWVYPDQLLSSVTPKKVSKLVAGIAQSCFPDAKRVWDMFGGTGNDAVSLSKHFEVWVTEVDEKFFGYLKQNCVRHRTNAIHPICADCFSWLPEEAVDLIYFDPPWGQSFNGNGTEEFDFTAIRIGRTPIAEMIRKEMSYVVKCPYRDTSMESQFSHRIVQTLGFPKNKLKFLFIAPD